jgi:hypothetical protein
MIGAEGAPYANFETDMNGDGSWAIHVQIGDLSHHGIVDRLQVWINDAPENKSVLGSDPIQIHL